MFLLWLYFLIFKVESWSIITFITIKFITIFYSTDFHSYLYLVSSSLVSAETEKSY